MENKGGKWTTLSCRKPKLKSAEMLTLKKYYEVGKRNWRESCWMEAVFEKNRQD